MAISPRPQGGRLQGYRGPVPGLHIASVDSPAGRDPLPPIEAAITPPRKSATGRSSAAAIHRGEADGFSMPAEWDPHDATWIGWPHNATDWPGKLAPVQWVYGEIVRKLAPGEIVRILVNSAAHEQGARRVLSKVGVDLSRIEFV